MLPSSHARLCLTQCFSYSFRQSRSRQRSSHLHALFSCSANADSRIFYSRIKGELDRDAQKLGFQRVRIMRPSLLGGNRQNPRFGEKVGSVMLAVANALGIARKSREIPGAVVATAMINSALDPASRTRIFTLDEVFTEAERV